MDQIILDLYNRPKLGWKDFEVGNANKIAIKWLIRWPDWPAYGLVIHGAPGCGKTHLGNLWKDTVGAKLINKENLHNTAERYQHKHFLIDGVDALLNNESEAFHLINIVRENNGSILILDRDPPASWNVFLGDLRSRLIALNSVKIQFPDETLLATILARQLQSKGIIFENKDKMCRYIINRLPRTFDAVLEFAKRIDTMSLQEKKSISLSLIKSLLESKQKN